MQKLNVNYKLIYTDILERNFPDKKEECKPLIEKKNLSAIDIIKLNEKIFGTVNKMTVSFNQNHRSYTKYDVSQILEYQKNHCLNNSQLANYFGLSRNTVTKWKKLFLK